jgi:hypothetical protein
MLKETIRILKENRRLYITLNLLFYGSIVVGLFYGFLRPDVGEEIAEWGVSALIEAPSTTPAIFAYLRGSFVAAAVFTFLGNLLMCSISIGLGLVFPPIVVLVIPLLTGVGFIWGVAFGSVVLSTGSWSALVHLLTFAIEGQSIILVLFIMLRTCDAILRPHRFGETSRWSAYRQALGQTGRFYMLIVVILLVSAIYEAFEILYIVKIPELVP